MDKRNYSFLVHASKNIDYICAARNYSVPGTLTCNSDYLYLTEAISVISLISSGKGRVDLQCIYTSASDKTTACFYAKCCYIGQYQLQLEIMDYFDETKNSFKGSYPSYFQHKYGKSHLNSGLPVAIGFLFSGEQQNILMYQNVNGLHCHPFSILATSDLRSLMPVGNPLLNRTPNLLDYLYPALHIQDEHEWNLSSII